MKKIKLYILSLGLILSFGFALLPVSSSYADTVVSEACKDDKDALICKSGEKSVGDLISDIVDLLLFGIGALSIVMIIVSGIRYSISMGDAGNITKAKNSLLYSVIGLTVALLAYPIVHWLIGVLTKK